MPEYITIRIKSENAELEYGNQHITILPHPDFWIRREDHDAKVSEFVGLNTKLSNKALNYEEATNRQEDTITKRDETIARQGEELSRMKILCQDQEAHIKRLQDKLYEQIEISRQRKELCKSMSKEAVRFLNIIDQKGTEIANLELDLEKKRNRIEAQAVEINRLNILDEGRVKHIEGLTKMMDNLRCEREAWKKRAGEHQADLTREKNRREQIECNNLASANTNNELVVQLAFLRGKMNRIGELVEKTKVEVLKELGA